MLVLLGVVGKLVNLLVASFFVLLRCVASVLMLTGCVGLHVLLGVIGRLLLHPIAYLLNLHAIACPIVLLHITRLLAVLLDVA